MYIFLLGLLLFPMFLNVFGDTFLEMKSDSAQRVTKNTRTTETKPETVHCSVHVVQDH